MGLFGKLFGAMKKTKEGLGTKLRQLFARDKIGEDFYDDLLRRFSFLPTSRFPPLTK